MGMSLLYYNPIVIQCIIWFPLQTAFHQAKMKPLSFLWFLCRHPAGSSSQFAICHRMVVSWIHISAGEPFVFWNLCSAPSGYSWHPNLRQWSNRGCLQSCLHFPKCKIFWSVGLVLTQKSTDIFSPVLFPLWRTFPSLLWLCHVEEKAFMNSFSQAQCLENHNSMAKGYFLLTSFLSSSFQGSFLSAVEVPTGDMP